MLPNIAVMHRNTEDSETDQTFLESQVAYCKSVPATHKLHYIQPSKGSFLKKLILFVFQKKKLEKSPSYRKLTFLDN